VTTKPWPADVPAVSSHDSSRWIAATRELMPPASFATEPSEIDAAISPLVVSHHCQKSAIAFA
jgi:hypothetical protein